METQTKVNSLVVLRGIAVMSVCFGHLGYALAANNALAIMFANFHTYGQYGIYMFFVISGFIIPLSMDKAGYRLKYYFSFLAKRAVRLHPPYLIALIITLLLLAMADRFKHIPFPETFVTILESCFYCHVTENNPVFWTLRVEAEYYLFMGLYFTALYNRPKPVLLISLPLVLLLSQAGIVNYVSLFSFLPFFFIGTLVYVIYNDSLPAYVSVTGLVVMVLFTFIYYAIPAVIAALLTALVILRYKGKGNAGLNGLGEISYSIYLIHFPIGVKLINLVYHRINSKYDIVLFAGAVVIVIAICFVFWKLVEEPFTRLSNKIRYGDKKERPKAMTVA